MAGINFTHRYPFEYLSLSYPKASDAVTSTNFLDVSNANSSTLSVNGESVSAYVIGDGASQSLSITGTLVDLLSALDVGFYASTWESYPSAMTVSCMQLWINGTPIGGYDPLLEVIADELKGDHWATGISTVNKFLLNIFCQI